MFGSKDTKDMKDTREVRTERLTPAPVMETPRVQTTNSVIGEGMNINGTIKVDGNVVIHGCVEGSVSCTGQVTVGKSGKVKAEIEAGSATIGGWVEGKIFARERVELETNSHLKGDVHSKSFIIQDGCFFQGNCTMGEAHDATRNRPAPVETTPTQKAA